MLDVLDPTPYLIYWGIGSFFFLLEWLWPARPLPYRQVFVQDLLSLSLYNLFFLLAVAVTNQITIPNYVPWRIQALPFAVRIIPFFLLVDCSAYWLHRLWHTRWLWPIHRWHHAPRYMYWLAGVRASFPQVLMAGLPFLIWLPLLRPIPPGFFPLYSVFLVVTNNWMHMNVTWRSSWLEWILVTPRSHHIHHGNSPECYMRNFGVVLSIWDRLFGTYADPETLARPVRFGLSEKVHPARLIMGL